MDANAIASLITTVGFPIVMCGALMWYIAKSQTQHKEETKEFTDALNKNTIVLQKLCDKLDFEDGKEENAKGN